MSGSRRSGRVAARAPGDVIAGKYALRRLLGRGGMGSVWHATNLTLGTDVAIKLILPSVAAPEAGERLFREARAAASLEHPGIVRVFDFGWSERKEPFIVMELLRGTTLGDLLATRRRLPAELAVQTLLPVAEALAAAHARGIVHRDLKPDNVMLAVMPQGLVAPKLVDFGIAKLVRDDRHLTREGAILGSPHYMAPEQACGGADVDERADVWAMCVVLYEAITGIRPFEPDRRPLLLLRGGGPTPTTAHGAGDEALWEIVRRGLEIDPEARWPSMVALGAALAQWARLRRVNADVSGSLIEHRWRTPSSAPTALELPAPPSQRELTATEWAAPAPQPPVALEATVSTAPPRPSGARLWPALALLAAAIAVAALVWTQQSARGAAAAPAIIALPSGPATAAQTASPAPERETMPAPAATPGSSPGQAPSASAHKVFSAGTTAAPRRPARSSAMPLPGRPDF